MKKINVIKQVLLKKYLLSISTLIFSGWLFSFFTSENLNSVPVELCGVVFSLVISLKLKF
jgi:hypothetical protein